MGVCFCVFFFLVPGATTCSAVSASVAYDVFVSVRFTFAWINSTLNGTNGPGISSGFGPNAVDDVEWYLWVVPLVGGVFCLLFFIYLVFDKQRQTMRERAKIIAYLASISRLFQDEEVVDELTMNL